MKSFQNILNVRHQHFSILSHYIVSFIVENKFSSFTRQLNIYGYIRIEGGKRIGSYYHPKFLKDRDDLIPEIKRVPIKSDDAKRKRRRCANKPQRAKVYFPPVITNSSVVSHSDSSVSTESSLSCESGDSTPIAQMPVSNPFPFTMPWNAVDPTTFPALYLPNNLYASFPPAPTSCFHPFISSGNLVPTAITTGMDGLTHPWSDAEVHSLLEFFQEDI